MGTSTAPGTRVAAAAAGTAPDTSVVGEHTSAAAVAAVLRTSARGTGTAAL